MLFRAKSHHKVLLALWLADLSATTLAWVGGYVLRWRAGWWEPIEEIPPLWWCVRNLPLVLLIAALVYQVCGLYQVGRRWSWRQEVSQVFKATLMLLLIVQTIIFYTKDPYQSRLASVLFWGQCFIGLVLARRLFSLGFRWLRAQGRATDRALIVGVGRSAKRVERSLRLNNWMGIAPIGYVEDHVSSSSEVLTVGKVDDLADLVDQHQVRYVFVALPLDRFADAKRVFRVLRNSLVEIRVVPDIPQATALNMHYQELEGIPVLSLKLASPGLLDVVLKRTMDLVVSLIGLILLSPVLALIAMLVKLQDWGPIFYSQERMGLNGHRFKMYKFRSMRLNAEQQSGPVWAQASDDRRTKLGAFLRETSLDELPQLYNVLRGDMSLVGPRPERPYFIDKFRRSIPRYMHRHAVKSGITGWAQVNGWRGNTSLRKRVQYDLYYIANWSVWLDIRILFVTVFKVMWDKNAY